MNPCSADDNSALRHWIYASSGAMRDEPGEQSCRHLRAKPRQGMPAASQGSGRSAAAVRREGLCAPPRHAHPSATSRARSRAAAMTARISG
jgi:hypothetical protein